MSIWKSLEKALDFSLPLMLGGALSFDYWVTFKAKTIPHWEKDFLINYFVGKFGSEPGIILSGLCTAVIYAGACYGLYKINNFLFKHFELKDKEKMNKYKILRKVSPYATMAMLTTRHIIAAIPRAIYL